jgi:hypothetical protein
MKQNIWQSNLPVAAHDPLETAGAEWGQAHVQVVRRYRLSPRERWRDCGVRLLVQGAPRKVGQAWVSES